MTKTQRMVATAAMLGGLLLAGGCGSYSESHDHNAPPPTNDVQLTWERLDSPGNYHTIIHACFGKDGLYLTQADNNSATVVPNDPQCINP